MNDLIINNFSSTPAYCEVEGLCNVLAAYNNLDGHRDEILEVGFNPNSGYVYLALELGITICSKLGEEVEYLVYLEDEEVFFETYKEALEALEAM